MAANHAQRLLCDRPAGRRLAEAADKLVFRRDGIKVTSLIQPDPTILSFGGDQFGIWFLPERPLPGNGPSSASGAALTAALSRI